MRVDYIPQKAEREEKKRQKDEEKRKKDEAIAKKARVRSPSVLPVFILGSVELVGCY